MAKLAKSYAILQSIRQNVDDKFANVFWFENFLRTFNCQSPALKHI